MPTTSDSTRLVGFHPLFIRIWEYFSIYWKLPALFLITLLVSTGYYSIYAYLTSRELLLDQIDRQMRISVEFIDLMINEDYFDRAVTPDAVSEDEYREHSEKMIRIAELVGLTNFYSFYEIDGKFHFTNNNGYSIPYFNVYDEHWDSLLETSRDGKERFDNASDSYGPSRSIIVKRTTSKGTPYLVGADILLSDIQELDRRMLYHTIQTALISFIMVGVFSYGISLLITRPLKKLNDYVLHVSRSDFASDTRIDPQLLPKSEAVGDETRLLARNFDRMQTALVDFTVRLREEATAREVAESELRIAGGIQQSFLPAPLESVNGSDIRGKMLPAKHAGGDLYDFFRLDDHRICFMIGDVSGKGMPAAMFMATTLTLFRAASKPEAKNDDDIAKVMAWVDRRLAEHNESCTFVTAIMGIFDTNTGELILSNGGHNPPVLLPQGEACRYLALTGGAMIGVELGMPFETTRLTLRRNDTLLLYTDGVTEAIAADGRFYGEQRLLEFLDGKTADWNDSSAIVEAVFHDVQEFSSGCVQSDDITVVALGLR